MLPSPFINNIPKIFRKDPLSVAISNKADTHLATWKQDLVNLKRMIRADEIPAAQIDELGILLAAGLDGADTIQKKRFKVDKAIENHKKAGLFAATVKPLIDAFTGKSCAVILPVDSSVWCMVGDTLSQREYFGTLGYSAADTKLGLNLIGSGYSNFEPGNFYINLHVGFNTPILSDAVILEVVDELKINANFAYLRLHLGYIDGTGKFVYYYFDAAPKFSVTVAGTANFTVLAFIGNQFWLKDAANGNFYVINKYTGVIDATNSIGFSDVTFFCPDYYYDGRHLFTASNNSGFANVLLKHDTQAYALTAFYNNPVAGNFTSFAGNANNIFIGNDSGWIYKLDLSLTLQASKRFFGVILGVLDTGSSLWVNATQNSITTWFKLDYNLNILDVIVNSQEFSFLSTYLSRPEYLDGKIFWVANSGSYLVTDTATHKTEKISVGSSFTSVGVQKDRYGRLYFLLPGGGVFGQNSFFMKDLMPFNNRTTFNYSGTNFWVDETGIWFVYKSGTSLTVNNMIFLGGITGETP